MEKVGHRMGKQDHRVGREHRLAGRLPVPKPGHWTLDNPQNPTFQAGE